MTHPAVVECAITGVPDEIRGQVVKATIVLSKTFKGKEGPELVKELQTKNNHPHHAKPHHLYNKYHHAKHLPLIPKHDNILWNTVLRRERL